jgi:hypothetical protein
MNQKALFQHFLEKCKICSGYILTCALADVIPVPVGGDAYDGVAHSLSTTVFSPFPGLDNRKSGRIRHYLRRSRCIANVG